MKYFSLNRVRWGIQFVTKNSIELYNYKGVRTLGSTNPMTHMVYISEELEGNMLLKVLMHELGHCVIFSYNLLPEIDRLFKPEYKDYAEEWICNLFADYALNIFLISYHIFGDEIIDYISYRMDELVA